MPLPKDTNLGIRFTSASEYRQRVTLRRPGTGSDDEGTPNPPVNVATVPAKITPMPNRGRPDVTGQIIQSIEYFEVKVRYRPDVAADWTLVGPRGETWTIVGSPNDLGYAKRELVMTVREINGGQG